MQVTEKEEPQVTNPFMGICHMQVCVPDEWDNDRISSFANRENPSGTTRGWSVTTDEELAPVSCDDRDGYKHVILSC